MKRLAFTPSLFLILAIIIPCASTVRSQGWAGAGPNKINGRILPSPGEQKLPAASTIVLTLKRKASTRSFIQTVREGGRFDFNGLPGGEYVLTVKCPGYVAVNKEFTLYQNLGDNAFLLYVPLGPREGSNKPSSQLDTVAVEQLQIPPKALAELERAAKESEEGKSEESIKYLKRAIEIHPEFPEAYNNMAAQHLRLGDPKSALEALEQSILISAENPMAFRNIGLILLQNKSYSEAIQFLERSLEQEPGHTQTLMSLGKAYFDSGRPAKAVSAFEGVINSEPGNATAHFALGYCYFQLKQFDEAGRELNLVLTLEPDGSRAELTRKLLEQIKSK